MLWEPKVKTSIDKITREANNHLVIVLYYNGCGKLCESHRMVMSIDVAKKFIENELYDIHYAKLDSYVALIDGSVACSRNLERFMEEL